MKILVSEAPVLCFYDHAKEITVQCDASKTCLGTALLQEGQQLEFASRALTDTEIRYAHIEKEILAVVWSLENFNQYLWPEDERRFRTHTS